jgi:hypothetical protein
VHALPCDVQLGDHGAQYNMQGKYAKLQNGGPNPFIDPATCKLEADISEAMFHAILAEQRRAGQPLLPHGPSALSNATSSASRPPGL